MTAGTKVLHVINGDFYAGGERVQDLLALRLPEFGYQVGFACLKEGLFAEKRKAKEVPLYAMPMRSKLDIGLAKRLTAVIRQEGYSLIHTHTRRAALLGQAASLLAGVPMVHHQHSPSDQDTEQGVRNLINSLVERFSLMRARKLIPVSNSLEKYLLDRGYSAQRIHTVWNGVPIQENVCARRTANEPMVVGSVALFRPRKGIEILLKAIAQLQNAGQEVRLHAVGPFETPEYEAEVHALVRELGLVDKVHWTGFTSDVGAEFRNMHVFVLPSLFGEGMPMVVLESMAAGLPVVSTLVEGIPEVIRNGREGLLVAPGKVDELAKALGRLSSCEVDGKELGEAGWQRQREGFSDLAMAKGVAEVYKEVLGV